MKTKAIYIGVDPGLTGCVAIIDQDSRAIATIDIATRRRPVETSAIKRELDVRPLADQLADRLVEYVEHKWRACIEMPFSYPGANLMGTCSLFQTYGGLVAMLDMMEIDTRQIRPSDWKRAFGMTKNKNQSLDIARQLWPTVMLTKKQDHDRAESLLLAEYARQLWTKVI